MPEVLYLGPGAMRDPSYSLDFQAIYLKFQVFRSEKTVMVSSLKMESNISKTDFAIIAIAVVVFFVSAGALIYNLTASDFQRNVVTPPLGQLVQVNSDVRLKVAGDYQWYKIKNQESVHLGDSIFTGENSGASVKIPGTGELQIEPMSLVTFSERDGYKGLNLFYGKFKGKVEESPIFIQTQTETQILKPQQANIEIERRGDQIQVKVLSGEAEVQLKNEVIPIRQGQVWEAEGGSWQNVSPDPNLRFSKTDLISEALEDWSTAMATPADPVLVPLKKLQNSVQPAPILITPSKEILMSHEDARFFRDGYFIVPNERAILLTWSSELGEQAIYQTEFSKTPDFSQPVGRSEFKADRIRLRKFPLGPLYWRVRGRQPGSDWSPHSERGVVQVKVPPPAISQSSQEVQLENGSAVTFANWEGSPAVSEYEFQYASAPESLGQQSVILKTTKARIQGEPESRVHWRVRALNTDRVPVSDFTSVQNIALVPAALRAVAEAKPTPLGRPIPGPAPRSPSAGETFLSFSGAPTLIVFSWRETKQSREIAAAEVSNFEFEISPTPDFSGVIYKNQSTQPRHIFSQALSEGSYFWRVRANYKGKWSEWSRPRRFRISSNDFN